MADFPRALPHGPLSEIFPDVFFVMGGFRFGPGISITRNMTVVRQGGELVVLSSVRLGPEGEAALDRLGKVKHVIRVGEFHGADDPYYVERYGATLWAPKGAPLQPGLKARDLVPGEGPLEGARVFAFDKARGHEVAVLLERDGGALVTCDSYQNWTSFDGCSALGKVMMRAMGFGPLLIGGPWAKRMGPEVRADFDRLLDEPFRHLIPSHGTVLRDSAKEGLRTAIAKRYD